LALIPAFGALFAGWITRWAPEARGGGTDAAIEAFHHLRGAVRRRVLLIKPLASLATLGSGGSGGREGPTMQIGAAIGSALSDLLKVSARERRLLLVAGMAAGIAAVFKTPLGAALLAIEVLFSFTHDREIDWMLPGIAPTGKYVEIPLVAIVKFRGDKLYHEHIYWDQASVLVQIGVLDPQGLPVAGHETAAKLLDETLPSNELMASWASSADKH
jgi:hypothetical protein